MFLVKRHGAIWNILTIFTGAKIVEINGKQIACDHCASGGKIVERWMNGEPELACHFYGRKLEGTSAGKGGVNDVKKEPSLFRPSIAD